MPTSPPVTILLVEDDDDEFELAKFAFTKLHLKRYLVRLRNGKELLDFLLAKGDFKGRVIIDHSAHLILLDLNMPILGGHETLKRLKSDPMLRKLPVIMLTGSDADEDAIKAYDLGANSFIRKPFTAEQFIKIVTALQLYWLDIVKLPPSNDLPGPTTNDPEKATKTRE
jgi:CheY-like chemotaxis protein